MARTIILSFSGGVDSTTLLHDFLVRGYAITAVFFNYGSKHNKFELIAANSIIEYYQNLGYSVELVVIDLQNVFANISSNLLHTGGPIPNGHHEDESMRLTVVPGRNLIFASILASIAESKNADLIALGVHSGDHAIYPDCRPNFIKHLQNVISASTDEKVYVVAPYLYRNKEEFIHSDVPYHLTRTCYKDQEEPCGECGACQEKKLAFTIKKLDYA